MADLHFDFIVLDEFPPYDRRQPVVVNEPRLSTEEWSQMVADMRAGMEREREQLILHGWPREEVIARDEKPVNQRHQESWQRLVSDTARFILSKPPYSW